LPFSEEISAIKRCSPVGANVEIWESFCTLTCKDKLLSRADADTANLLLNTDTVLVALLNFTTHTGTCLIGVLAKTQDMCNIAEKVSQFVVAGRKVRMV
jgi:hypothetical protein